jgi:heme oxygenase
MPRCFSISIQSDVAWRAALRAFTLPAIWMAPENSSSFSVSVVLPASGWEMMANVRRRRTCRARSADMGAAARPEAGERRSRDYRGLHALYAALEAALAHHQADLAIAMLQAGPLRRTAALAADLQSLQGAQWQQAFTLQSAMRDYVHRLQALAATGSRALVAHAYVRYLGDLNGGQALARLVVRRLDLVGAEGTRFYDFGTAEEVAARRTAFRAALGQLPLRAGEDDLIVEEARWAFRQHQRLFEELQSA